MRSYGRYKAQLAVKEAIDKSGMSVQEVSDKTKLAYNTILSYYRNSVDGVKLNVLGSISNALGVTPGELFSTKVIEID